MSIKFFSTIVFAAGLMASSASLACSYCDRIEQLREKTAKVKADPLDEKTSVLQTEFVDQGISVVEDILKKNGKSLGTKEISDIVSTLALVTDYDAAGMIGESLLKPLRSHFKALGAEIETQKKAGKISARQAHRLTQTFVAADGLMKFGNAGDDEKDSK